MGAEDTKIWRLFAVTSITLVLMCATALGVIGTVSIVHAGTDTCQQVNALRIAVTSVLQQSEKALPANPYFKQHPNLIHGAEMQIQYDLSLFQPIQC